MNFPASSAWLLGQQDFRRFPALPGRIWFRFGRAACS